MDKLVLMFISFHSGPNSRKGSSHIISDSPNTASSGQIGNTSASYWRGPGFQSRTGNGLSEL